MFGAGDQTQGLGSGLSITFITPIQPTPSAQVSPVAVLTPVPVHGLNALTTQANTASVKTLQVRSYTGVRASITDVSTAPPDVTTQTAAANSISAAKGGSPEDDRLASYHATLRVALHRKWAALTDRPFPSGCALSMTLGTSGVLNATSARGCASEDSLRLEAAALMAQPLPYAGYEAVFAPELELDL